MSQEELDEERIKGHLLENYFQVEVFSKQERENTKSPDFRVLKDGEIIFFCEVKTIIKDEWLTKIVSQAPEGKIVGGCRTAPEFNRISAKIHEAVAQFRAANPHHVYPNVLAFVSHDDRCKFTFLLNVYTGLFFATDGTRDKIFARYSDGRIKDEKLDVDLILWFRDAEKEPQMYFPRIYEDLYGKLCAHFNVDQKTVRQLR